MSKREDDLARVICCPERCENEAAGMKCIDRAGDAFAWLAKRRQIDRMIAASLGSAGVDVAAISPKVWTDARRNMRAAIAALRAREKSDVEERR